MFDKLKEKWRQRRREQALMDLVRAAQDSVELAAQLRLILAQGDFERRALLRTWCHQLAAEEAPRELIDAMTLLQDDRIAARAATLLEQST